MNLTRIIECHGEVWVVKFGFGGQGGGESRENGWSERARMVEVCTGANHKLI